VRFPTRLALLGVAVLAVTLTVVAVLSAQIVRVSGRRAVDRELRDELTTLATDLPPLLGESGPPTDEQLRNAARQYLALHPGSTRHLTVLTVAGASYSNRTGPEELLELRDEGELPTGGVGVLRTVDTSEGPVRVLSAPLVVRGREVGVATVLGPLREVRDDASATLSRIAAAGAVGLVLGGIALVVVNRRAVRPLTALAAAARTTGGDDLSARVPEPARRDEVGDLAREFNRMLDRLSDDAEHRRRLVSAVSHELRTPLAVARGHLEVFDALVGPDSGPVDGEAVARLAGVLRGEIDRLTRIAADLEAVVRGEAGGDVTLGPVFVPDVFDELRDRLAGLGATAVRFATPPPVVVEADEHRLAQALLNLVSNALVHTPPGTSVTVDAVAEDHQLRLTVTDDGPGVDPAVRDRAFEPFVTTRADGSSPGQGLGLAVVRQLVEAQHGTVSLESGPGGTTATIRLPLDDDADAAD